MPDDKKQEKKVSTSPKVKAPAKSKDSVDLENISVRQDGLALDEGDILFTISNHPVVIGTNAIRDLASQLAAIPRSSDNAVDWLYDNRDQICATVFVPVAKGILRRNLIRTVRPVLPEFAPSPWDATFPGHLAGLHIVTGPTASGKSSHIANFLRPDVNIRWGEPAEMFDQLPSAYHPLDFLEVIASALVASIAGYTVSIDSFRELVFSLDGPAGAGGIRVDVYSALTAVNNIAAGFGTLLTAVVNPMVAEEHHVSIETAMEASVAGITVIRHSAAPRTMYRSKDGRKGSSASQSVVPEEPNHHLPTNASTSHRYQRTVQLDEIRRNSPAPVLPDLDNDHSSAGVSPAYDLGDDGDDDDIIIPRRMNSSTFVKTQK
nr:MAG: hypothetical protein 2 [Guangxi cysto-like virus 12]